MGSSLTGGELIFLFKLFPKTSLANGEMIILFIYLLSHQNRVSRYSSAKLLCLLHRTGGMVKQLSTVITLLCFKFFPCRVDALQS